MLSAADRNASWRSPLTDPSNYSSPFVLSRYPPSLFSAARRYDITGIGINLWLIHLHFIPSVPRHPRGVRAYEHTDVPKRAQTPSKSFLLLCSSYPEGSLFAFLPRDGSNPISSSQPHLLPLCSFHLLYRDSNSGPYRRLCTMRDRKLPGHFLRSSWYFTFIIIFHDIRNPFFI